MPVQVRFPRHPTYAAIVSTLALVLAMSVSGAYAADKVGSGGIKKNAIKTRHIAAGGVTGSDIADSAVGSQHIAAGGVNGSDIGDSAVGSQHIADGQVATSDIDDGAVTRSKLAPDAVTSVMHYQFPAHDFALSSSVNLSIPGVTVEEVASNVWSVQLVRASGNTYPIPGWGLSGDSQYRLLVVSAGGAANVTIARHSGAGEAYATIRVVRIIPTQTQVVP